MQDIDIAREANLLEIDKIVEKLNIDENSIIKYGRFRAKIEYKDIDSNNAGKLILVTAINPTPFGEGKTTTSIGLADGLARLKTKPVLALREPSLGPVFGIKGGATGGGRAQIVPMEDINLHFTGDIHAITAANNLLSAIIDNHIYFGNELGIENVVWRRCLDINDRALRDVQINLNGREEHFDISVASEIMAVMCLSENMNDLKRRIGNIIVGYDKDGKPITAKDLKADGALTVLLKDAIKPNLVQTLENNPCIIHGGPFANIAHGCNSVIATKTALKLGDYIITEAGFGADLGAEKFLDIKCRNSGIFPNLVVCVVTVRALKYNGGVSKDCVEIENISAMENGLRNLYTHVENLQEVFGVNVLVTVNKFPTDTEKEINRLIEILNFKNINCCINDSWLNGGEGAVGFAEKVIKLCAETPKAKFSYELDCSIKHKIESVSKKIYRASGIEYSEKANESISKIEKLGYRNLPICIAKTQYSLSDDPKNITNSGEYTIHIKDVILKAGAEFIVVMAGNIYTMPGLPKHPASEKIDIDLNENVMGIF